MPPDPEEVQVVRQAADEVVPGRSRRDLDERHAGLPEKVTEQRDVNVECRRGRARGRLPLVRRCRTSSNRSYPTRQTTRRLGLGVR